MHVSGYWWWLSFYPSCRILMMVIILCMSPNIDDGYCFMHVSGVLTKVIFVCMLDTDNFIHDIVSQYWQCLSFYACFRILKMVIILSMFQNIDDGYHTDYTAFTDERSGEDDWLVTYVLHIPGRWYGGRPRQCHLHPILCWGNNMDHQFATVLL